MPDTDRFKSALSERYAIEREIGAGGMATVYLARDLKHDRQVALKVLRADLSAVIGTERFLAEVKISAKLDHPHILTLIDSGSADGILYYVLPYVRGESLRSRIERERQLGIDDALSIITQVGSALDYAHAQGVVHRDIKPENILLHEGEAVLADFGIALAVKEAGGNRLTETGLSLGTPQYMSPEQATGDRSVDKRSDIYSLGAVFYEMITGEPPVTGATAQAMIAKLLTEKPVKMRVVRETVSPAMERATEKALAKVPADRFATAGEFVRALSVASPEERQAPHAAKFKRAAVGVAAIIIAGAGLWVSGRKTNGPIHKPATLTDRIQLTNTGRVSIPAISGDGKTIAYVVTECNSRGCRYGIEMQEVAGGPARKILDGATALYEMEVSPDRRNLLVNGSINGVYGTFLVPTGGGTPRILTPNRAAFFAGGDSLLYSRSDKPGNSSWILVSGLDGTPADSIHVEGAETRVTRISAIPGTERIMYARGSGSIVEWRLADRSGKVYSSIRLPRYRTGFSQATADALWVEILTTGSASKAIVRIPFDAATGRLAERGDTVYTGAPTRFSVTADGGTLLVDEGTTEYSGWVMPFNDMVAGKFADEKRILRATSVFYMIVAPDGKTLTLSRDWGARNRNGGQWALVPVGGSQETLVPGRHVSVRVEDSTTLVIRDVIASGTQLSLFDRRTGQRNALLSIPDSTIAGNARIHHVGWVWAPSDGQTINFQRDGDTHPKTFNLPAWYKRVFMLTASRDGRTIGFMGFKGPSEDSLGIGTLSLTDGKFSDVWHTFGELGNVVLLDDGSIGVEIDDTPESATFYRLWAGRPVERLGSTPRPIAALDFSRDLKVVAVTTRDHRGDAWTSRIVK